MERFTWNSRDALLLAFVELESYGIAVRANARGTEDEVRADLARELAERAPFGTGSYVFWLHSDAHRFAGDGLPPLHTSGAEVDRALAAVLHHQGLAPDPTRTPACRSPAWTRSATATG